MKRSEGKGHKGVKLFGLFLQMKSVHKANKIESVKSFINRFAKMILGLRWTKTNLKRLEGKGHKGVKLFGLLLQWRVGTMLIR